MINEDELVKKAFLIGVELGYKECARGNTFENTMKASERMWDMFNIFRYGIQFIMSLSK